MNGEHPVRFSVCRLPRPAAESPDHRLPGVHGDPDRAIVLANIGGYYTSGEYDPDTTSTVVIGGTGLPFLPPLLMIVFRQKYPRWWFDWKPSCCASTNSGHGAYRADERPLPPRPTRPSGCGSTSSTPTREADLNRWLPLVKWFLAIPHYIVLAFLYLAAVIVVIGAWFAILFTGRYPRGIFDFVEGVIRWHNRVVGYALSSSRTAIRRSR